MRNERRQNINNDNGDDPLVDCLYTYRGIPVREYVVPVRAIYLWALSRRWREEEGKGCFCWTVDFLLFSPRIIYMFRQYCCRSVCLCVCVTSKTTPSILNRREASLNETIQIKRCKTKVKKSLLHAQTCYGCAVIPSYYFIVYKTDLMYVDVHIGYEVE